MVKKEKKANVASSSSQKPRKSGLTWRGRLMLSVLMLVGAAFLPVTVVLIVGMLPSFVAFIVDTSRARTRALTVSLMNFITCFPFLMDAASGHLELQTAYIILMEPLNVVVMFGGAAAGYFLDWALAGISNVVMVTKARTRLEAIENRQEELVRRWGPEVTGDMELDAEGFPLIVPASEKHL